jgi:alpha-galactosidase
VAVPDPGTTAADDVEVAVEETADGWSWSVANRGDRPLPLDAVALVWDAGPAGEDPRLLRNGYQSWSPCGVARLGVDDDPSRAPGSIELARALHHADTAVAAPGELRSELVTVLRRRPGDPLLCAGFLAGTEHDGTLRARLDDGRVTLAAEAFLGGAVLAPGETRTLHDVRLAEGDPHAGPELLAGWAAVAGEAGAARTSGPFTVGWCSWYQYFHGVTEADVRANLARAADWPFDVFQLDDGFQRAIGDWLLPNERFPGGLEALAHDITRSGATPGIWLAPFLAAPDSAVLAEHPEWTATHRSGRPLVGSFNPSWGGAVLVLDTTRPDVLAHLEDTAARLVALGHRYLKLDFTYAPAVPGTFADPSRTPAQRVRAGMEAIRRGAGDDTFLLGCGLPLGAGTGVVDGMRIGPDVAPWWEPGPDVLPGYAEAAPATVNAWRSTLVRSALHRRLWLNDPDCLMLRTADTRLSADAVRAWALAVGTSGGMALVSDDLALLDAGARRLLDEVVALGRAADDEARTGPPPRCDDLLDAATPGRLSAAGHQLVGDPGRGVASRR